MDDIDTPFVGAWTRFKRTGRTDYKRRLEQPPVASVDAAAAGAGEAPAPARAVRALARHPEAETLAFQCVAGEALGVLERVRYREHRAAEAALSLAQREKLQRMEAASAATVEALRGLLTPQGAAMLRTPPAEEAPEALWWFALSEALQALDESLAWLRSILGGQPRGSGAYAVGACAAQLLREHHTALLAEAEQWMV